jgi:type IV pilus assembly protein PilY1
MNTQPEGPVISRRHSRGASARVWLASGLLALTSMLAAVPAVAQTTVALAQAPLLALKSAPGLVMLTMSRDHRLFYAAYNDTSDIDGDGTVDVGFNPAITYYGNFVSDRCYDYVSSGSSYVFRPVKMANPDPTIGCNDGSPGRWHGNWMNWVSTSRMDALRRVLYGGYRQIDSDSTDANGTSTVLQGAFIPKDSHVWGKEFLRNGAIYDIRDYTNLSRPSSGKQHLFVVVKDGSNTSYPFMTHTNAPVLRYITNANGDAERIWAWASADVAQGIGSNPANFTKLGGRSSVAATDLVLRVEACVPIGGVREAGCVGYPAGNPTVWKPTGVLHDYAANDSLKFGLLTGSYHRNYSGGVVRRNIASFKDEIDPATGQFNTNDGIARTIDRITIHGWNGSIYDCGYQTTRNRYQGECKSWGAPIAEMMYEGLRYFSGKSAGTAAFTSGVGTSGNADRTIGFSAPPTWLNPYRAKVNGGNPICSRPVQMVIADPLTSFDNDQLPGTFFGVDTNFGASIGTSDLAGLNVSTQSDAIWNAEGLGTRNIYVGQSGANYDGNPTAKSASSFSQIIGHAPDETQSRGSYYAAGVARFARGTGVDVGDPLGSPAVPTESAKRAVDTISLALGSLTPKIEFPNPNGGRLTIVPLSKAVANAGINKAPGAYQATGAITGFYFKSATATSVTAIVTFSDGDQGTDNETDAQVQYDINVSGNSVSVVLTQLDPSPGGIQSNTGYVISGTTNDGLYLDTRSKNGSAGQVYYLDTLAGQSPKSAASPLNGSLLPTYGDTPFTRTFTMTTPTTSSGYLPHDPLWYAAKYGGAGVLDSNGDPTNYFKVTNPASLPAQMGKAFRSAAALAAVASTSVVGVGQRSLGNAAIYQANYDSLTWSSRLYAFSVQSTGTVSDTTLWEASSKIPVPSLRNKLFLGRGGTNAPLQLTSNGYASLGTTGAPTEQQDFGSASIYEYLIGDKSLEERKGGTLRNRGTTAGADYGSVIGDIVNSDPQIISRKDYGYGAGDATYAAFLATLTTESLAVGSNNGFFHIFDAAPTTSGGGELLGFIPQAARTNIKDLASTSYSHRYFVDGAIGLGHAKIRVPAAGVPAASALGWRSMVVAAGGGGAKTVFAIDASSQTYTADSILWEINESTALPVAGTLGNVMGRPAIGKLANGTWVAIFGNGYNSTAGTASLFVVNLETGAIIKQIATNSSILNNGLGSTEIALITTGNRDTIEYVYGADYKGNIWRFNLSATDPNTWPTTAARIYTTPTGRPITAEIKVGPATGHTAILGKKMVYFGTGSYLSATDPATTTPAQALYGIYDDLTSTSNSTAAVLESALTVSTLSMPSATSDQRLSSTPTTPWYDISGKKGWVLAFAGTATDGTPFQLGERVVAPPVRYTAPGQVDAFLFTSIVPGIDDCVAGIDAWITGIDAMTGGFSKVFDGISNNSLKISGGSPRGVFVLQDGGAPALYISQTVFNGNVVSTTFQTSAGGSQSVSINGTAGQTRVLGIKLASGALASAITRQVWRQLK